MCHHINKLSWLVLKTTFYDNLTINNLVGVLYPKKDHDIWNILYLMHIYLKKERKIIIKSFAKHPHVMELKKNTYDNLTINNLVGVLYSKKDHDIWNILYLMHTMLKKERKIIIRSFTKTTTVLKQKKNTYDNLMINDLVGVLYPKSDHDL